MQDLFYNLPKERFSNLTLEKMLDPHNDRDLLQAIKKADTKLDKITKDVTITLSKKMLLSKEVYINDGTKIAKQIVDTLSKNTEELEENNKLFEVNRLRADALTADQKALLPLVKDQYINSNKISDNDNFNKALVFLADNGLIDSQVLKSINLKTSQDVREKSDKLNSKINFIDDVGTTYVHLIEKYENDVNIKNIENTVYTG